MNQNFKYHIYQDFAISIFYVNINQIMNIYEIQIKISSLIITFKIDKYFIKKIFH